MNISSRDRVLYADHGCDSNFLGVGDVCEKIAVVLWIAFWVHHCRHQDYLDVRGFLVIQIGNDLFNLFRMKCGIRLDLSDTLHDLLQLTFGQNTLGRVEAHDIWNRRKRPIFGLCVLFDGSLHGLRNLS